MEWIFALPWSHREDFWLNVLAGIPFLFFDLVIITLLLPITIQWWDEHRWRPTRLVAMAHLLRKYREVDDILVELARRHERSGRLLVHETLYEALNEHADRMDVSLQTALPVLGPELSQDVLALHYKWKDFLTHMRWDMRSASSGYSEGEAVFYVKYHTILLAEIGVMHRRLRIKYADKPHMKQTWEKTDEMVFDTFAGVYVGVAKGALRTSGPLKRDFDLLVQRDRAHRRMSLLTDGYVIPVLMRGPVHRLLGRHKHRLWPLDPDTKTRVLAESEAVINKKEEPKHTEGE